MRFVTPVFAVLALMLGAAQADAKSCSTFAVIKSYDADAKTVEISWEKGKMKQYFPKPEGAPADSTKIPKGCRGKTKKAKTFVIKPTGGRMSVTQVRSNFEGKMLNDTEDPAWVPSQIEKLVAEEVKVVIVVRPGKKKGDPVALTTIYLPVTEEEMAEIERINNQAEDV